MSNEPPSSLVQYCQLSPVVPELGLFPLCSPQKEKRIEGLKRGNSLAGYKTLWQFTFSSGSISGNETGSKGTVLPEGSDRKVVTDVDHDGTTCACLS